MAETIKRFEDLIAWQKARLLTQAVYALTRQRPCARDFGFCHQIQRATVSIMANIAEGFERHRNSEFHQFLSIAKASCAEVRSLLYVACDVGYLPEERLECLLALGEETARVIGGLRAAVESIRRN